MNTANCISHKSTARKEKMYNEYEIRPMPLSVKSCQRQVEHFLNENGLRLEEVDYYACVFRLDDDEILAGGGLKGDTVKCVAVNPELRDEGFSSRLISHIVSEAHANGHTSVKVFTKPQNRDIFETMGFHQIASAPKAILMENGTALRTYCRYLSAHRQLGRSGCIVMNANPFTRGHRYLIEQAAKQVDWLHVIVVSEERSLFSYEERMAMIQQGTEDLNNVFVLQGSPYAVSATTFPTYFLKELTDATDTQIALDLDLFIHFIAPHLGSSVRFVGSEPTDMLTNRYNQTMKVMLPASGYEVVEIPRHQDISATEVRRCLNAGQLRAVIRLAPPTSWPYLLSYLAAQALMQELDTTPKPGLVDRHDNGAHCDMDYRLMQRSIEALKPYFAKLARQDSFHVSTIRQIGLEAEQAMLTTTHGVNTHKGALFAIGLTVAAVAHLLYKVGNIDTDSLRKTIAAMARLFPKTTQTHGATVLSKYQHLTGGALDQACQAYPLLFADWLPFYRSHEGHPCQKHMTLLRIMATLEDTNVYYRKGEDGARLVQAQARELTERVTDNPGLQETILTDALRQMNNLFIRENISPGGAADMLALTIFINACTDNSTSVKKN